MATSKVTIKLIVPVWLQKHNLHITPEMNIRFQFLQEQGQSVLVRLPNGIETWMDRNWFLVTVPREAPALVAPAWQPVIIPDEIVRQMRQVYAERDPIDGRPCFTYGEIAELFDVSYSHARTILLGEARKDVV